MSSAAGDLRRPTGHIESARLSDDDKADLAPSR
jgi:hypothetical protein